MLLFAIRGSVIRDCISATPARPRETTVVNADVVLLSIHHTGLLCLAFGSGDAFGFHLEPNLSK